ncbi:hypothetical protein MIMGU_mgv1a017532mg [Erythranthe guttata]|uniref:Uncharacterized protein n=1 Tax=Erythranthe guttata TaxID=4155 RepID=A0A022PY22_ERYGU|nr:hypothetical protein MIMGU_mgv1a017532mg [Erythranthe guttata]
MKIAGDSKTEKEEIKKNPECTSLCEEFSHLPSATESPKVYYCDLLIISPSSPTESPFFISLSLSLSLLK